MLIIKNAQIVEKDNFRKVNIYVQEGKVKDISSNSVSLKKGGAKEIDVKGHIVFPGFIDAHVHFDDPGFTEREDFETGTRSAAAGGITTIIDMPCTSIPPVINAENFEYKFNQIKGKAYVDYIFWGGVTPEQVETGEYKKSLPALKERGIVGVKFYTVSGMELYPRMTTDNMDRAFRVLKELDLVCAVHAEDYYLVNYYSNFLQERGRSDPESWAEGRTYEAEPLAIWSVVGITEKVGNKLHIVHLSTKEGLNIIRWAKAHNIDVTVETCPQYLLFTLKDFKKQGAILKISPPLRNEEDKIELWKGLKDSSIDFICSDHAAGRYPEEKSSSSIWQNYAGIPGIQLMTPAIIHYGYHQKKLTLKDIQRLMSENPAKRYGLYPQKGVIRRGSDADFTIIDIQKEWSIDPFKLESKGKYSPLAGKKLKGEVYMTIVRGEVVYTKERGIIGQKGYGKLLKRK